MIKTESELRHIFHPVEHAIIASWLGIEPPVFAAGIDIDSSTGQFPVGVVSIDKDMDGKKNEFDVPNAVARIVLSTIQHKLPQWAALHSSGLIIGRYPFNRHINEVSLLPQFLFEINWATSGPGIEWPVSYHVGFLPYYDVYVVTSSADSPDMFGYNDLAIGYFSADEAIEAGSLRVIKENWSFQADNYMQAHWEELLQTGLFEKDVIVRLADSVWDPEAEEVYHV